MVCHTNHQCHLYIIIAAATARRLCTEATEHGHVAAQFKLALLHGARPFAVGFTIMWSRQMIVIADTTPVVLDLERYGISLERILFYSLSPFLHFRRACLRDATTPLAGMSTTVRMTLPQSNGSLLHQKGVHLWCSLPTLLSTHRQLHHHRHHQMQPSSRNSSSSSRSTRCFQPNWTRRMHTDMLPVHSTTWGHFMSWAVGCQSRATASASFF